MKFFKRFSNRKTFYTPYGKIESESRTHIGKIESESRKQMFKMLLCGKIGKIDILVVCGSEGKGVESKLFFMKTPNSRPKLKSIEPMLGSWATLYMFDPSPRIH